MHGRLGDGAMDGLAAMDGLQWMASDGQLGNEVMEVSRWTARDRRLGDVAIDGSQWTAYNEQLKMNDSVME